VITKHERLHALENQIQRLNRRIDTLNQRSNRLSWVRLAIFLGGFFLAILVFFPAGWPWSLATGFITLLAFSIAAYVHRQVERGITRHKIWLQIKTTQVARIQLDWANIPSISTQSSSANHPFEVDLDITGERSLHQLITTAVSLEGRQRVREWLLNTTPDLQTIRQRQALIKELAPLSRFRDKLTLKTLLASTNVAEHLEGKKLLNWLKQQDSNKQSRLTVIVATALSALTITLLLLNILALIGPQLWIIAVLLSIGWFFLKGKDRGDLFEDAYFLRDAFAQLSTIFEYLETYPYGNNSRVKKLCEPFFIKPLSSPSVLLKRLSRIASAATLAKNQLLWLIVNALLPWDVYVAIRLNHYKALLANTLPAWLDTWFELEALNSFASFSNLHPEYIQPKLVYDTEYRPPDVYSRDDPRGHPAEQGSHCLFRASGLGHPLIVAEQKVVNDFTMNESGQVVIVTGSNMSGKSTFLRTIGINLCLAYAGGPVNATSLQTSLFRIFTCIKVSDSVTDGYSYFYAEVKRLKALLQALEQADKLPLFFLIDEIFKGTNNRERLIGSRAYIHALVGQNCLGVISTHDLELVHLADALPEITNYHFKEDVIDSQMVFDYILRPGPCPTTNALKIMQMEGLPIEASTFTTTQTHPQQH
jgi:ABC-type multidrug transport system fused ATPase/permease subunit